MTGREFAAISLSLILGSALFFGPTRGGTPLDYVFHDIAVRSPGPYTIEEQREMSFLSCLEETLMIIPDGSSFSTFSEDEYFIQRTLEISYPRLRVSNLPPEFFIFVNSVDSTEGKELVRQTDCFGVEVRIARNG